MNTSRRVCTGSSASATTAISGSSSSNRRTPCRSHAMSWATTHRIFWLSLFCAMGHTGSPFKGQRNCKIPQARQARQFRRRCTNDCKPSVTPLERKIKHLRKNMLVARMMLRYFRKSFAEAKPCLLGNTSVRATPSLRDSHGPRYSDSWCLEKKSFLQPS